MRSHRALQPGFVFGTTMPCYLEQYSFSTNARASSLCMLVMALEMPSASKEPTQAVVTNVRAHLRWSPQRCQVRFVLNVDCRAKFSRRLAVTVGNLAIYSGHGSTFCILSNTYTEHFACPIISPTRFDLAIARFTDILVRLILFCCMKSGCCKCV